MQVFNLTSRLSLPTKVNHYKVYFFFKSGPIVPQGSFTVIFYCVNNDPLKID